MKEIDLRKKEEKEFLIKVMNTLLVKQSIYLKNQCWHLKNKLEAAELKLTEDYKEAKITELIEQNNWLKQERTVLLAHPDMAAVKEELAKLKKFVMAKKQNEISLAKLRRDHEKLLMKYLTLTQNDGG